MDPVEGLLAVLFPQTPGPISGPHSYKVNKWNIDNSVMTLWDWTIAAVKLIFA